MVEAVVVSGVCAWGAALTGGVQDERYQALGRLAHGHKYIGSTWVYQQSPGMRALCPDPALGMGCKPFLSAYSSYFILQPSDSLILKALLREQKLYSVARWGD